MTDGIPRHLSDAVRYLKGVGPRRAEILAKADLGTVGDILRHPPRDYEDQREILPLGVLKPGMKALVRARVVSVSARRSRGGGKWVVEALLSDGKHEARAVWFNQPYIADRLKRGTWHRFYGKAGWYEGLSLESPRIGSDAGAPGGLVPVYTLPEGIPPAVFRGAVDAALADYLPLVPEPLPPDILARHRLIPVDRAFREVHRPVSLESARDAVRRFKYEELFLFELVVAIRRRRFASTRKAHAIRISPVLEERILRRLPFTMTAAQRKVVAEVRRDLESPRPMNRLLQGEVGSGKTAVAVYAMLAAVGNRLQAVLMAPTEILAGQHYRTLCRYLDSARVRVVLITSGLAARERKEILAGVSSGDVHIAVGTHALLDGKVAFRRLGLVVVDEQHKFGVLQRARLAWKGATPDTLVMTATPIPRSLALTVFGDLDISVLGEMPPGRQPVTTEWISPAEISRAHDRIREEISRGRQAYVVYPLVEEGTGDGVPLKAAVSAHREFQERVFPGFRVGLLHGRMASDEKNAVMRAFLAREIDLLVASTVVEVGLDVPNATLMMVEHAERFGLAQLHQLRGRIGRGRFPSVFIMVGDSAGEEGRRRLEVLSGTSDGFRIAEEDLRLRGPGEFFGARQHGLPEFLWADLIADYPLLVRAREDAFALVEKDAGLAKPAHAGLRRVLRERFGARAGLVGIG
ncbi:MAG: ATP-dependent DNA helicase RecG [Planctomycetota bacterium]